MALWLNRMTLALAAIGGLGTLGIMAIINADVIGRGAFGTPVPATAEIVSAMIVAIVFLQLPKATAAGRNVRSDMLLNRLGRNEGARMDKVPSAASLSPSRAMRLSGFTGFSPCRAGLLWSVFWRAVR